MKAFKFFIKPFKARQRSVKIIYLSPSGIGTGRVESNMKIRNFT